MRLCFYLVSQLLSQVQHFTANKNILCPRHHEFVMFTHRGGGEDYGVITLDNYYWMENRDFLWTDESFQTSI